MAPRSPEVALGSISGRAIAYAAYAAASGKIRHTAKVHCVSRRTTMFAKVLDRYRREPQILAHAARGLPDPRPIPRGDEPIYIRKK